jgi:hypothetical protein
MMLIDWMQEFSDEYLFKRTTFYLAVFYVDFYLTKVKNIPMGEL